MIFENIKLDLKNNIIKNFFKSKEYLRNETVFDVNDLITNLAFIKRGSIRVEDENKNTIRLFNQNEYINLYYIFSNKEAYDYKYISSSLTTISYINKLDILDLMSSSEIIKENILSLLSNEAIKMSEHIRLLSYTDIRKKICEYLLMESKQKKASSFVINYTKTELAHYLNIKRHLLTIELQKLINEGIIANQNKLYTIIDKTRMI